MVVAAALVSLGVSSLVACALLRRARRTLGPSWEEWRDAERIGGRWKPLIRAGASIATLVCIYGFGVPGAVRAALIGGMVGFCTPLAAEGVRRYLRAKRVPAEQDG
jgi:hypothetical protein